MRSCKKFLAALLAAILTLALLTGCTITIGPGGTIGTSTPSSSQFLSRVNAARRERGKNALTADEVLNDIAKNAVIYCVDYRPAQKQFDQYCSTLEGGSVRTSHGSVTIVDVSVLYMTESDLRNGNYSFLCEPIAYMPGKYVGTYPVRKNGMVYIGLVVGK